MIKGYLENPILEKIRYREGFYWSYTWKNKNVRSFESKRWRWCDDHDPWRDVSMLNMNQNNCVISTCFRRLFADLSSNLIQVQAQNLPHLQINLVSPWRNRKRFCLKLLHQPPAGCKFGHRFIFALSVTFSLLVFCTFLSVRNAFGILKRSIPCFT